MLVVDGAAQGPAVMPSLPLPSPAPATGLGLPNASAPYSPVSVTPTIPVTVQPGIRPANLSGLTVGAAGPAAPAPAAAPPSGGAGAQRLTLEEARQRALANNKLLKLAAMNIEGKEFATNAAIADYYPKLISSVSYFTFDQPLGNVVSLAGRSINSVGKQVTTPGLHVTGPGGKTLVDISPKSFGIAPKSVTIPPIARDVAVVNENAYLGTVMLAQPITALLKIRQGVKIARADEQIAQAQLEQGARAVSTGVDQLYWGLVAAQRLRAGVLVAIAGAEQAAKLGLIEARIALVEARQGLQGVDSQIADLEQQMNGLLDQPACTRLEVVEPPFPPPPVSCGDEAGTLAVQASPEIREAEQNIVKAQAATDAAKVDYLPNVAVVGGYANQSFADYIQPNFGYLGVQGSWTLFEWGKRKNVVREREMLIAMAALKVRQVEDEVRQKAVKAFRELQQTREALALAGEKATLRVEAQKQAKQPLDILKAAKDTMEAQVDVVKADLAYRMAYIQLMSLIGKP
jgi:outer membrane protein TolC